MKSKKVLIVDNNDLNRKLFESLIGQLCCFDSAKSGIEAVGKASKEKFDLILMNIELPNMDGVTASKTIWRQATHHCPIIAIGADSPANTKNNFVEMGFDDLITKPICPKDFLESISAKLNLNPDSELQGAEECAKEAILDKKVLQQLLKYNTVDSIKSIYIDFLEEFDQLLGNIETAFQNKNQQQLIDNLHTIKGNSGSLGANTIFTLSSDADAIALAMDWDSLEYAVKKLKNERIIFEGYLKEETTFKL